MEVIAGRWASDEDIDKFRSEERARMAPMREAARREAFVQGWIANERRTCGDSDEELLLACETAIVAYAKFASQRGPA